LTTASEIFVAGLHLASALCRVLYTFIVASVVLATSFVKLAKLISFAVVAMRASSMTGWPRASEDGHGFRLTIVIS